MLRVIPQRVGVTVVMVAALGVGLVGCFPQGNISKKIPLMATRVTDGSLEVVFPLCRGDAVTNLGVLVPKDEEGQWWVLRQGDRQSKAEADEVVALLVGDEQMAAGSLSDRWPVIVPFEKGHPIHASEVEDVFVDTTRGDGGMSVPASVDAGSWLVEGSDIEHQVAPKLVEYGEGMRRIGEFCEQTRN